MRRLYYIKANGQIIWQSVTTMSGATPLTVEQEMGISSTLSDYVPEEIDVMEIDDSEYSQDFADSSGYWVNTATDELEFNYIPNPEPEYVAPLSEQLVALEATYMYDSMMKDLAIDEAVQANADLMYVLMMEGVL